MNEDLTHLKTREELQYFQTHNLNNLKLSTLEMFHIHNYIGDGKYNIISKAIIFRNICKISFIRMVSFSCNCLHLVSKCPFLHRNLIGQEMLSF